MSIPTLDLARERREAARQLVTALEDPGFLYVKNVQGFDPGNFVIALFCASRSFSYRRATETHRMVLFTSVGRPYVSGSTGMEPREQ